MRLIDADAIPFVEDAPTAEVVSVVHDRELRNKIIDEFAEEMKRYIAVKYGLTDISLKEIEDIVEKMKGE